MVTPDNSYYIIDSLLIVASIDPLELFSTAHHARKGKLDTL